MGGVALSVWCFIVVRMSFSVRVKKKPTEKDSYDCIKDTCLQCFIYVVFYGCTYELLHAGKTLHKKNVATTMWAIKSSLPFCS